MGIPIIILVGESGSGKDTIAGFMVQNHGAIAVAQADPMKRLVKLIFGFSDLQLWGPSENRNAHDSRLVPSSNEWDFAQKVLNGPRVQDWLKNVVGETYGQPFLDLTDWFHNLRREVSQVGLTPRAALQTLGTEWGRTQGLDLWSNYTIQNARTLLAGGYRYDRAMGLIKDKSFTGPTRVVISDGRFRNEIINVQALGGTAFKIISYNRDSTTDSAGVKGHVSESEMKTIPDHFFTGVFTNDKSLGLEYCEEQVISLIRLVDNPRCFRW